MAVVLCGEELILRGERTVDLPDIESSPVGGRCRVEVRRQVGKGHESLALRERRDGPVRRQPEQARRGQSSSQSLSTGDVFRHASPPGGPIKNLKGILPRGILDRQRWLPVPDGSRAFESRRQSHMTKSRLPKY